MDTPPHPHTGLQTVSWLYDGEIEHRDSAGRARARSARPGQPDDGGRAASSTPRCRRRPRTRCTACSCGPRCRMRPAATPPFFEHRRRRCRAVGDATLRVFVGSWLGITSPVTAYTPLVGGPARPAGGRVRRASRRSGFEYGLVVDRRARPAAGGRRAGASPGGGPGGLGCAAHRGGRGPLRVLVIGGAPFGEPIVMWWNFVGRTHDEIVAFREQWQDDVIADADRAGPVRSRRRLRRRRAARARTAERAIAPPRVAGIPDQGVLLPSQGVRVTRVAREAEPRRGRLRRRLLDLELNP